ncbi:MAG: hypothetical protein FWF46_08420 [Oscillospiraceae bacterium]|nr:hypothetical protein [Oscillospiraceae bacterium]
MANDKFDNILNMNYNELNNNITNLSYYENFSLICMDSTFDNDNPLLNFFENNPTKKLFVISDNKITIPLFNVHVYNKINKNINYNIYNKNIFICLSLNSINTEIQVKKLIKTLIKLNNIIDSDTLNNKSILYNITPSNNNKYFNYINDVIKILSIKDKKIQYELIYDAVCNKLDNNFIEKNYCDFKGTKCIAQRENKAIHQTMGCCYSFKDTFLGYTKAELCKFLNQTKCETKCMACKLFTCKYLKEKGIHFKAKDDILLSCFFNKKQLEILSANFFTKKEVVISKLLEKNNMPYIFYYMFNQEYIR